jgi:hypothetical protein
MNAREHFFDTNDRTLRQFSGLWILFFGAIALQQYFKHHRLMVALIIGAFALGIGSLGLARPRLIKPVFVVWMKVAYPIGWVVSRIVLGTLFYGLFTPVAFVLRLIGRDALALKARPKAETYWHSKPGSADKTQYLHQY